MPLSPRHRALLATTALVATLGTYAAATPESPLAVALFHAAYDASPNKRVVLDLYRQQIALTNGHRIVDDVDRHLCTRLSATPSADERSAILDFYVAQAGWREGPHIAKLGRPLVELLIPRLSAAPDDRTLSQTLILIESARRGATLHKPYPPDDPQAVRTRYQRWWSPHRPWPELRRADPLADHPFQWRSMGG